MSFWKPLGTNVAQKKRRDCPATVSDFKENNTIRLNFDIKESINPKKFRIGVYEHIFGVFKIKKLTSDQLASKVMSNVLRIEKSEELLKKNLGTLDCDSSGVLEIPEIKVNLTCSFTHGRINVPVKGRFCKHLACFDLKNAIQLNLYFRKWTCPLCH